MSGNKARDLLWPTDTRILLRLVFLNVGQGASTLVLVRSGDTWKVLLVDINLDCENEGIDVPALVSDLLNGDDLEVFVNTHPHSDHLKGITELSDRATINAVWHSGHKPGRKHDGAYRDLCTVIEKVKKNGGSEVKLLGSREENTIFDARYYVLAPAEYVCDDIEDEDPETRSHRIHEQCAVLRFGAGERWGLLPGDADREAFERHIMKGHKERLSSVVLGASHHGSRTFFKRNKEDDPYRQALDAIDPEYIVISAKNQNADDEDPPHVDAIELYQEKRGSDSVLQTGERGYSFISDIYDDGSYSGIRDDKGEIRDSYPLGVQKKPVVFPVIPRTRVDDRPMGA